MNHMLALSSSTEFPFDKTINFSYNNFTKLLINLYNTDQVDDGQAILKKMVDNTHSYD
jgi:hypothetical protein